MAKKNPRRSANSLREGGKGRACVWGTVGALPSSGPMSVRQAVLDTLQATVPCLLAVLLKGDSAAVWPWATPFLSLCLLSLAVR